MSSKKEKAFCIKWYPNDYLSGTMYFDLEEKGGYMELLMLQCNTGRFTIEQAQRVLGAAFPKVWKVAAKKFETDGSVYWNTRMALEIEKWNKYSNSRKENREGSKNHNEQGGTYDEHMEPELENVSKPVFKIPVLSEVSEYFTEIGLNGIAATEAEKFINYYESKGWMVGKTKMKNWKASCRNWKGNINQINPNKNNGEKKGAVPVWRQQNKDH